MLPVDSMACVCMGPRDVFPQSHSLSGQYDGSTPECISMNGGIDEWMRLGIHGALSDDRFLENFIPPVRPRPNKNYLCHRPQAYGVPPE